MSHVGKFECLMFVMLFLEAVLFHVVFSCSKKCIKFDVFNSCIVLNEKMCFSVVPFSLAKNVAFFEFCVLVFANVFRCCACDWE